MKARDGRHEAEPQSAARRIPACLEPHEPIANLIPRVRRDSGALVLDREFEAGVVALGGAGLVLSAIKPAESGDGFVVRVLNPTDADAEAELRVGVPFAAATSVRLDETPDEATLAHDGERLRFPVPAHGLRSVHLR